MSQPRKLSTTTVALLLVVLVYGTTNVTDNLAALGLTAIPSWIAVGVLYFLPLSLMMAELASAAPQKRGGIYSYMEVGLGPTWAFTGTWAYFVANLIYLQSVCTKVVINASLATTGRNVFEGTLWILPLIGAVVCLLLTLISTLGVGVFSRLVAVAGRFLLFATFGLIVVSIGAVFLGFHASATPYQATALVPALDLKYFSTFSWLIFAIAGAEAAGPYVHEMKDPSRSYPRAVILATLVIGALYVLGTIAVSFLLPVGSIDKATALFDSWRALATIMHLPAVGTARLFMTLIVLISLTAYVVWMESPVRAMFADVPAGTFPAFLTSRDEHGTHRRALWTQAVVVCVLILVPLASILTGTSASDRLISLLNDVTSLALVVPYAFVAVSYIRARRAGLRAPFQMVRSTPLALAIAAMVLVLSVLAYAGAGAFASEAAKIDWIYMGTVYFGPWLLVVLGLVLRRASMRHAGEGQVRRARGTPSPGAG